MLDVCVRVLLWQVSGPEVGCLKKTFSAVACSEQVCVKLSTATTTASGRWEGRKGEGREGNL